MDLLVSLALSFALPLTMLLLLIPLCASTAVLSERVSGKMADGSCVCNVDSSMWAFPTERFENVTLLVKNCKDTLQKVDIQVEETEKSLPEIAATVKNVTARLEDYQYLNDHGLYNDLAVRRLLREVDDLSHLIGSVHNNVPSKQTQELTNEVEKLQRELGSMRRSDDFNMETTRERLRKLNNRVQGCHSFYNDFRSACSQRLMQGISAPVTNLLNRHGTSYPNGAWGRDTQPGKEGAYWVMPLLSGNAYAYTFDVYPSYEDLISYRSFKTFSVASAYNQPKTIRGSGSVLYDGALYYWTYSRSQLVEYTLETNAFRTLDLPKELTFNFPYCYYSCHAHTEIDLSIDEMGLWVIYATEENHGNIVLSRIDKGNFTIAQTWKTRLFKKSVTNAFMVCGVLYATRYVSDTLEEVFYAFDTATGMEDVQLALPLQKLKPGVAHLEYNPEDKRLYMYNDAYLLSYKATF